jgi:sialate O-acetylesterase
MKTPASTFDPRVIFYALFLSLTLMLAAPASADVRLPAIFGDHMVLQQGMECRVWGWADPGEEVAVSINSQMHKSAAGKDGRWQVKLQPLSMTRDGESLTLTVQGKNKIELQDILVGEVWICSGQSNMAWAVSQANDPDLETKTAKFPRIRLISVPQVGTQEPQDDFKGKWEHCTPDSAAQFSAVGYFFGRQLHQTLDVPIGLIDNAWGGSACEAWIRRDILETDAKYAPLMDRWVQIEKSFDADKEQAALQTKLAEWRDLAAKARAEGKQPPPQPRFNNPLVGNARPANIYCGVLKPTIGYGIRGVIWYQGESNAGRAYQYRDMFPLMIQSWRDEWQQGDFPFYFVQLADFKDEKTQPAESDWAELREAQTMTLSRLPNCGQAVIIDIGEGKDIHPKNKQDVAKRLARWALARDYGLSELAYRSPEYKSMEKQGSKIVVTLDHVGGGLAPFDTGEPVGFAIAGDDKKFVWAKAKLVDSDKVEVWSDAVTEPVAVRYAWADNPVCNLYSKEGLPVTPFRTDDWPGVTAEAK